MVQFYHIRVNIKNIFIGHDVRKLLRISLKSIGAIIVYVMESVNSTRHCEKFKHKHKKSVFEVYCYLLLMRSDY